MNLYSPIIVLGMHRSGTTLVSSMLEKLGIYMGWLKERNNESIFHKNRNDEIIRACGGEWDNPNAIEYLYRNQSITEKYINLLRRDIDSYRAFTYWGSNIFSRKQIKYWGWKDPRTSITLPLWLSLYPNLKVIRIIRNGVDVASSLNIRSEKYLSGQLRTPKKNRIFPPFYPRFSSSIRCLNIADAFKLWEEYLKWEETNISSIDHSNIITIRYEDLLETPEEILHILTAFIGIEKSSYKKVINNMTIKNRNRYKFISNNDLYEFYNEVSTTELMKKYGYDALSK